MEIGIINFFFIEIEIEIIIICQIEIEIKWELFNENEIKN